MSYGMPKTAGHYTSGARYKRFYLSNAERMNQQVKASQKSQLAAAGIIFSQKLVESQGLSEIAIQQVLKRTQSGLLNLKV